VIGYGYEGVFDPESEDEEDEKEKVNENKEADDVPEEVPKLVGEKEEVVHLAEVGIFLEEDLGAVHRQIDGIIVFPEPSLVAGGSQFRVKIRVGNTVGLDVLKALLEAVKEDHGSPEDPEFEIEDCFFGGGVSVWQHTGDARAPRAEEGVGVAEGTVEEWNGRTLFDILFAAGYRGVLDHLD